MALGKIKVKDTPHDNDDMAYEVTLLELMKAGGELDGVWSTNLKDEDFY